VRQSTKEKRSERGRTFSFGFCTFAAAALLYPNSGREGRRNRSTHIQVDQGRLRAPFLLPRGGLISEQLKRGSGMPAAR
jgi:hypothetical protein